MKKCAQCERLRRAFAEVTRLNVEIGSLQMAAHSDRPETIEVLREASLIADQRWRAARADLAKHFAEHAPPESVRAFGLAAELAE